MCVYVCDTYMNELYEYWYNTMQFLLFFVTSKQDTPQKQLPTPTTPMT